jgi:cytochrome c551/c552
MFRDQERMRKFGITRAKYGDMLLAQGGACAICHQPETATRNGLMKALAVDHCHASGEVRGLLCVACNTGIGKFKDDRNLMLSAIKYLDKHQGREQIATKLELVRNANE